MCRICPKIRVNAYIIWISLTELLDERAIVCRKQSGCYAKGVNKLHEVLDAVGARPVDITGDTIDRLIHHCCLLVFRCKPPNDAVEKVPIINAFIRLAKSRLQNLAGRYRIWIKCSLLPTLTGLAAIDGVGYRL